MERKLIPWWPDAGEALGGISRTTTYELIRSGELPSVTIGRRRFVAVADLDAFVEGRRTGGQGGTAA
ncbi:DNA binding domain-containing protein, excisionase family [Actinomadura madurae]|uniref:DNA binding domain-containing protein, excisionase family n=1 Tax=Actinomadura madurae TaxID=1993 RepID=A0A1I5ET80_9ACTN|nr:helix-turn-helix domain-containing protein [Actinomadura madurae]SFO14714.1 DNA binding domain-containing protein, excisionase family [Actinomadura madurae]